MTALASDDRLQGASAWIRSLAREPYETVKFTLPTAFKRQWRRRITDVMACPDNLSIPRVPGAGSIQRGWQMMHNGLLVEAGAYYGYPMALMLMLNRGVHEPEQEKAFREVLSWLPSGSSMLELGAFWGFYSMWFASQIANARVILVDASPRRLASARRNFARNHLAGEFLVGSIGRAGSGNEATDSCVDEIAATHGIARLNLLHADIDEHEHDMLLGAREQFTRRGIDFAFVSTHGEELHASCLDMLQGYGHVVLCESSPRSSYSFDGLIVTRDSHIAAPAIAISRRPH